MNTVTIDFEKNVDRLLEVLQEDINNSKKNLERLDQLRSMVIKRDDKGLGKILVEIQSEAGGYQGNDLKRQLVRRQLAANLNCSPQQVTLSRLEDELSGEIKTQVSQTKSCLQKLALRLKKEYMSTAMLLSECSRLNRMLLKEIMDFCQQGTVTYSPNGSAKRDGNSAFMNLEI